MKPNLLKTLPALILISGASAQSVGQSLSTAVAGQPQMTGGNYTLDAAFDPVGQSVSDSTTATIKTGYAARITDPRTLELTAPSVLGETSALTPSATATLDDGTTTAVPPDAITWDVVAGPLNPVGITGLVRSRPVLNDTQATIMATWLGISSTHDFTVLNANNDDVPPVAADGIDDTWQFHYFDTDGDGTLTGPEATAAAANADPDGDSQNNSFEFLSGHAPDDPDSQLTFTILDVAAGAVTIGLSKLIPTTRYTLLGTTDLAATDPWSILGTPLVGRDERNFRATHQAGSIHFYQLRLDPAP